MIWSTDFFSRIGDIPAFLTTVRKQLLFYGDKCIDAEENIMKDLVAMVCCVCRVSSVEYICCGSRLIRIDWVTYRRGSQRFDRYTVGLHWRWCRLPGWLCQYQCKKHRDLLVRFDHRLVWLLLIAGFLSFLFRLEVFPLTVPLTYTDTDRCVIVNIHTLGISIPPCLCLLMSWGLILKRMASWTLRVS